MKLTKLLAGTALAFAAATANAGPVSGTFDGASNIGPFAGLIDVGSSLDVLATMFVSGNVDFAPIAAMTPISLTTPIVMSAGNPFNFTSSFGSFTGTLTNATLNILSATSRSVSFAVTGAFTPAGPLAGFSSGPAAVTGSATQTGGAGSAVSFSFTFAPMSVPAPAALAVFGLGLMGLGLARRAR